MANSTKARRKNKPQKPYPDFPLFSHSTGRWAKKVRGKLHYFGYWNRSRDGDWQAALDLYQEQRDDLHAGRTVRVKSDGLTIRDLCNRFLTAKRHLLDTSEIKLRTFQEYHQAAGQAIEIFGKNRFVEDLAADDFDRFRSALATGPRETRPGVASKRHQACADTVQVRKRRRPDRSSGTVRTQFQAAVEAYHSQGTASQRQEDV